MFDSLTADLENARLIEKLTPAIREAGALIEEFRARGITEQAKADNSPVTEADLAAEKLLTAAIRAIDPDAIIVGEEASAAGAAPDVGGTARFWLIDPLDGTRSFVAGSLDYSVNVGLVEHGAPVLGLVLHSPTQTLWTGAPGLGAWKESPKHPRQTIRSRTLHQPPSIVTSRSHLDPRTRAWVAQIPGATVHPSGSSLKLCLLAEGDADVYPRYGPTCEWDTAAADAILRAAGGLMQALENRPFIYGKPGWLNDGFIGFGDPAAAAVMPPFVDPAR